MSVREEDTTITAVMSLLSRRFMYSLNERRPIISVMSVVCDAY